MWDAKGFEDVIALLMMASKACPTSQSALDAELRYFSFSLSTRSISSATLSDQDGTLLIKAGEHLPCGIGPGFRDRCLDAISLERWRLAAKGLVRLKLVRADYADAQPLKDIVEFCPHGVVTALHAESTTGYEWRFWYPASIVRMLYYLLFSRGVKTFIFATILLPLIYGGVHLTAWDFEFPSPAEGYLWKICSICIMSLAPVTFLTLAPVQFISAMMRRSGEHPADRGRWVSIGITLGSLILFTFSRVYLVIESFISLRDLPLGAFAATPWLQAIPHI